MIKPAVVSTLGNVAFGVFYSHILAPKFSLLSHVGMKAQTRVFLLGALVEGVLRHVDESRVEEKPLYEKAFRVLLPYLLIGGINHWNQVAWKSNIMGTFVLGTSQFSSGYLTDVFWGERIKKNSSFKELPDELLKEIFSFLDISEVARLGLVSKRFKENRHIDNKDVLLSALKENFLFNKAILQYTSKTFFADREFMIAAAKENAIFLDYASEKIRADQEFMTTVMKTRELRIHETRKLVRDFMGLWSYTKNTYRHDRTIVKNKTRDLLNISGITFSNEEYRTFLDPLMERIIIGDCMAGGFNGPLANRVLKDLDEYGVNIKPIKEEQWDIQLEDGYISKTYRETLTLIFANCLKAEICDQLA